MLHEEIALIQLVRLGVMLESQETLSCEGLKWRKLYEMACQQGLPAICLDGLQKLYDAGWRGMDESPELGRLKRKWLASTLDVENHYAQQWKSACKLGDWLKDEGIRMVVMKGFSVAECYPVPAHRFSSDLDCFLVREGEKLGAYESGNRVVESHGVKVNRDYYKNSSFNLPGLHVENHHFCTPVRGSKRMKQFEALLEGMLLEGKDSSPFEGAPFYRPAPMFSSLFLTEHAYSHFLAGGLSLRHILDWELFRRRYAVEVDWERFRTYCEEYGFWRFAEAMDHLGEYLLGGREREALSEVEQRFLESVLEGMELHHDKKGLAARIALVGNHLRGGWKYRAFSDHSRLYGVLQKVYGYFFEKMPRI